MLITIFGACKEGSSVSVAKAPVMPDALPQVDMCGPQKNTEAYLKEIFAHGGLDRIIHLFSDKMKAPAEISVCVGGELKLRASYVYLQTVDPTGKPIHVVGEWGSEKNSVGTKTWSLNIYRENDARQPFGFGMYYVPQ